ncbi:unnamed protein product [Sphagnum tenellum]
MEYKSIVYSDIPDRITALAMLKELFTLVGEVESSTTGSRGLHSSCMLTFTSSAEGVMSSFVHKGSVKAILDTINLLLPQFGEADVAQTRKAIKKEFSRLVRYEGVAADLSLEEEEEEMKVDCCEA